MSPSSRPRVLVTGATGFVGRHLCEHLARSGWTVRALVRVPAPELAGSVELAFARGLGDRDAVRSAVEGCERVVHLAARVHVMRDQEADPLGAYRTTNVEGTRVLIEEAADAGVRAFVFASSVKAVGESGTSAWTEETAPAPVDAYGLSKLEAESIVRAVAERHGIVAPIVRLPLVYGPRVRANMLRLFDLIDRGIPIPLGGIDNRRSLLYVGNLTAALAHLADPELRASGVFFLSDGEDLSTPDLVRAIAQALGRRARLVPCPVRLLRACARVGDALDGTVRVPITSRAVDRLLGSLTVDASKVRRTGFVPPFSVAEGLAETAAWYRAGR